MQYNIAMYQKQQIKVASFVVLLFPLIVSRNFCLILYEALVRVILFRKKFQCFALGDISCFT